ncbi:MAG: VWA domain-containing protein [Acidobacteriota bacterium]|nr:VWA domain-containing protein [Acidobacteriota bacterium]
MTAGTGHLLRNMVLFARLLRALGIGVTSSQVQDWVDAVGHLDLRHKADFREAAQAVLITRREDLEWFRAAFALFFVARDPRELEDMELGLLVQRITRRVQKSRVEREGDDSDGGDGEGVPEPDRLQTYSDTDVLRRKDFADLEGPELAQVKAMIRKMEWRLDVRRTRRRVPARRGAIDLRRSLRKSLGRGGELVEWAYRNRKTKRRPLALICDISGSMEPYSRILLQFMYVASRGLEKTEAFVFGTRLTRITRQLKHRDVDLALRSVHEEIEDFGGGTRIGEAIRGFNYRWSRRVLGEGAAVLVISDGWDRGDPDILEREMARLKRSAYRVIWLNPLLGSPRYEPLTRGIQAALPHIDDFLPVHNLQSLEDLGLHLQKLARGRRGPSRWRGRAA